MQELESDIGMVLRRRDLDGEGEASGTCVRKGIGQWKWCGDVEALGEKVLASVAFHAARAREVGMETRPLRKHLRMCMRVHVSHVSI